MLYHLGNSQVFDVDTLLWSGLPENRINLVILGDGYQLDELQNYIVDSQTFIDDLFSETPYKEYKAYFNVVAINVPSNESGASHPGDATDVDEPVHPVSVVDNYFGSTFDSYDIHRLLVPTNTFAITDVLASNFPSFDQVFLLVNSPYYGGSGGRYPVASQHETASEIAIHELGHSFVNLNDEYYAGNSFARESLNMTKVTDPNAVKWKNWMDVDGIGIYQHCCDGNSASWYRPHQNCKMRRLGPGFCAVCTEGTIERIHSLISVIESYEPNNSDVIDMSSSIPFTIDVVEPSPNTLNIEWNLNGSVYGVDSTSILLKQDDLLTGKNQLQVTVVDTTALVKIDNFESIHLSSILWTIDALSTSVTEVLTSKLRIKIFPNPIDEILNFSLTNEVKEDYQLSILNAQGQLVMMKNYNSTDQYNHIRIGHLESGIYFANFSFESGISISRKLVKH